MNIVSAMTTLSVSRPSADASAESAAAWFASKAELHNYIAELGGPDAARETQLALAALRHAEMLHRGIDDR